MQRGGTEKRELISVDDGDDLAVKRLNSTNQNNLKLIIAAKSCNMTE